MYLSKYTAACYSDAVSGFHTMEYKDTFLKLQLLYVPLKSLDCVAY